MNAWVQASLTLAISYLVGSIPFAYLIVRRVVDEDITAHGTGNIGAMNVRRSTGSWGWFVVAMVSDAMKGIVPVSIAKIGTLGVAADASMFLKPWGATLASVNSVWSQNPLLYLPMLAVAGAVMGHNYSVWMAILKKRFTRTGKGLATGGGAMLAYDWRYFVAVVAVGLLVIALTRYMMAGQVAAALTLPVAAFVLRSPDLGFASIMGAVVYLAHHKRFIGMLQGHEPRLYVNDRMGPRG
ncbi:MAG: glycerol-3-phosphate acyltransferase [Actinomycetota bacterium]|nr:glycerol-3-phosphate acyltransferase [Actinomycetota bacterium]